MRTLSEKRPVLQRIKSSELVATTDRFNIRNDFYVAI